MGPSVLGNKDLQGALDALRHSLPDYPEVLKQSLYLYLCSFTLLMQAFQNKPWEPLDVTTGQISSWAAEFFSQYEDINNFDDTYEDFVLWIKNKQSDYIKQLS